MGDSEAGNCFDEGGMGREGNGGICRIEVLGMRGREAKTQKAKRGEGGGGGF